MMMRKILKILSLNKTMVLLDQAIFSGNSFLTTLILVRILSPGDFGVYTSIVLGIYLIISVLSALIIQPFQVNLSRVSNKSAYITYSYLMQLGLVLVITLIIFLLLNLKFPLLSLYNNIGSALLPMIVGMTLQDFLRKLFLANGKLRTALLIDSTALIIQLSVLIMLLVSNSNSLNIVVGLIGLSYVPAIIVGNFNIKFNFSKFKGWNLYTSIHYNQGKWLLMTAIIQWWSSNLFIVASGIFIGINALGAFRLVQALFGAFNMVLQTFENYVLPQVSNLMTTSPLKAKMYLKQIGFKSALLFCIALLPLFLFSEKIIVLVGGFHYAQYAYVIKGMCILYILIFLGYPIRIAIRALILNKKFFMGYVFSLLFSLLSFNFLLKEWGLKGAIIGLIVSQCIVLSYWQTVLIKRKFNLWK